ncbi:MAG: YbhB/YbcL family Raf kinase inhibitor-like protein [Vulcanimicrobiaceae bacterium]
METTFTLGSETFADGDTLPISVVYTACKGGNISPDLSWKNAPAGAKSFALDVHDPDAPTGGVGWFHWVAFDIPVSTHALAKGAGTPDSPSAPKGIVEGTTDFGSPGYSGPCPPVGDPPHHYVFTLYALDVPSLPLDQHATGAALRFTIRGHVLGKAVLIGRYGRPR